MKSRLPKNAKTLISFTIFSAVTLALFGPALFSGTLWSPDGAPLYRPGFQFSEVERLWGWWTDESLGRSRGHTPFHPQLLQRIILPPFVYHVWGYIIDVFLIYLAALYFFAGRKIRGFTAHIPALALAFSGYSFTLIPAAIGECLK